MASSRLVKRVAAVLQRRLNGRRHRTLLALLVGVMMLSGVSTTVLLVGKGPTAHAASYDTDILLVHGIAGVLGGSDSDNCDNTWGTVISYLENHGWSSSNITAINYFAQDTDCSGVLTNSLYHYGEDGWGATGGCRTVGRQWDDNGNYIVDTDEGTNSEDIERLGCKLDWYIYNNYTQFGKPVLIVAHSMGGLIARWGVYMAGANTDEHDTRYPGGGLIVPGAATIATPHQGVQEADPIGCSGCWEANEMVSGSTFMTDVNNIQSPGAGLGATHWFTMAMEQEPSTCVGCSVPCTYTVGTDAGGLTDWIGQTMPGSVRVLYENPCYTHGGYLLGDPQRDTTVGGDNDIENATAYYCDECACDQCADGSTMTYAKGDFPKSLREVFLFLVLYAPSSSGGGGGGDGGLPSPSPTPTSPCSSTVWRTIYNGPWTVAPGGYSVATSLRALYATSNLNLWCGYTRGQAWIAIPPNTTQQTHAYLRIVPSSGTILYNDWTVAPNTTGTMRIDEFEGSWSAANCVISDDTFRTYDSRIGANGTGDLYSGTGPNNDCATSPSPSPARPATPPPPELSVELGDTPEHFVAGDFNGDGKADVADIYNYGNNTIGIWVWPGTSSGLVSNDYKAYSGCSGCWDWSRSKFVAGDFNGDGKTDLAGIYDYGNNTIGIWIWPGTSNGLGSPYKAYSGCSGCWDFTNSKWVAGDFNGDGKTDLAGIYDYGYASTGIWIWSGSASSPLTSDHLAVRTGQNEFSWSNAKWAAGDFNGDGRADLVALYDYGSCTTGVLIFPGNATNPLSSDYIAVKTGTNMFCWSNSKIAAGDFNGDGDADLAVFYNYLNATSGILPFPGNATSPLHSDYIAWKSGTGGYNWNNG